MSNFLDNCSRHICHSLLNYRRDGQNKAIMELTNEYAILYTQYFLIAVVPAGDK
jgi:hypothetical protein